MTFDEALNDLHPIEEERAAIEAMRTQRDELVAALERVLEYYDAYGVKWLSEDGKGRLAQARAALAKVKP